MKKKQSRGPSSDLLDVQGDPRYAFFPAGTTEEIEISLVPRGKCSKKEMDTEDVKHR